MDLFEAGAEVVVPHAEGAGVVGAEIIDGVEDEAAGAGELGVDAVEREQERAGKNVFLDEIHAAAELVVAGIGAGDKL